MARAPFLNASRNAALLVTGTAAVTSLPRRPAFAEAPSIDDLPHKKPIYTPPPSVPSHLEPSPTSPNSKPNPISPTPTDRLQTQIRAARLWLHGVSLSTENFLNSSFTYAFRQETQIANTIASLAPSPQSGEQLLPGAIYCLVATLAGSIVFRNRGLFLRATTPAAVGVAAGWALIPVTMENVSELVWGWEREVPALAEAHLAVGQGVREAWRVARDVAGGSARWVDETSKDSRRAVEGWVEKGR